MQQVLDTTTATELSKNHEGSFTLKPQGAECFSDLVDDAHKWKYSKIARDQVKVADREMQEAAEHLEMERFKLRTFSSCDLPLPQSPECGPLASLAEFAKNAEFVILLFVHSLLDSASVSYVRECDALWSRLASLQKSRVAFVTSGTYSEALVKSLALQSPVFFDASCTLAKRYRIPIVKNVSYNGAVAVSSRWLDADKGVFVDNHEHLTTLYHWHNHEDIDKVGIKCAVRKPSPSEYVTKYGMGMGRIQTQGPHGAHKFLVAQPSAEETWRSCMQWLPIGSETKNLRRKGRTSLISRRDA